MTPYLVSRLATLRQDLGNITLDKEAIPVQYQLHKAQDCLWRSIDALGELITIIIESETAPDLKELLK